jgi:hypothetical protein
MPFGVPVFWYNPAMRFIARNICIGLGWSIRIFIVLAVLDMLL